MRHVLIAAALLGACSVDTLSNGAEDTAGGYEMQIAASADGQIYLVTGPDDSAVAARVAEGGGSELFEVDAARLALGEARAAAASAADLGDAPKHFAIRGPGFELSVDASDDSEGQDGRAQVSINAGGRQINVDASGRDSSGNAVVRIAGASAEDAREFINDADQLSAETRRQMLEQLGLAQPD